jgi:hypothetical protein
MLLYTQPETNIYKGFIILKALLLHNTSGTQIKYCSRLASVCVRHSVITNCNKLKYMVLGESSTP